MFFNKQAASAAISKKQSPKDVVVDKEIEEAKENILGTNNKRLSSDDKDNSQVCMRIHLLNLIFFLIKAFLHLRTWVPDLFFTSRRIPSYY